MKPPRWVRASGPAGWLRSPVIALATFLFLLGAGPAAADERMNGMVGLFYSPYNGYSFEYDLILQLQKSKEWMGNMVGPFISEEVGTRSNRLGAGLVVGKRLPEKGTYALSSTVFIENRWSAISKPVPGGEIKLTFLVFGFKMGLIDWDRSYYQAGFSY